MEVGDLQYRRAGILATAGVCAVAIFFLPGIEGGYRLARWGGSGMMVAALALYALRLRHSFPQILPPQKKLFSWAAVYFSAAILLPLHTPYPLAHVSGAALLATGFLFSYLVALIFQKASQTQRMRCLRVLAWTGGVISLIIILQQAGLFSFVDQTLAGPEFRGQATFGNPNWAAAFLLPLVPVALGLRQGSRKGVARRTDTALFLILAAGVLATLSKGGVTAMMAGIFLYLLLSPSLRWKTKAVVFTGLLCLCGAILYNGILHGWHETQPWMRGRLFLWQAAVSLLKAHSLTGIGLGGFLPAYPNAAAALINGDPNAFMPLGNIRFLHNDILQIAVEGGIPCAIIFVMFIFSMMRLAHRHCDSVIRGAAAGLGALVLYGLVDSPLHMPASWLLFWFLAGILMALPMGETHTTAASLPPRKRRVVMAILLVTAVLSVVQGFRHLAGIIFWDTGRNILKARTIDRSLVELSRAAMLLPEVGGVRLSHARALAMKERYDEALAECKASLNLSSDFSTLFYHADLTEYSHGRQAAKQEWEALSRDFPVLVRPHYELGRLALVMDDPSEAQRQLLQAQSNPQDSPGAREYRYQATALLQAIELMKKE